MIEYNVDLNSLFSLNIDYSFKPLRMLLEKVMEIQQCQKMQIDSLNRMPKIQEQISFNDQSTNSNAQTNEGESINEVRRVLYNHDNDLNMAKTELIRLHNKEQQLEIQMQKQNDKFNEINEKIKFLESHNKSQFDPNSLRDLQQKIQLATLKSQEEPKKDSTEIKIQETPIKSNDSLKENQNNLLINELLFLQESQNQMKENIKNNKNLFDVTLKKINDNESSYITISKLIENNSDLISKQKDKIGELEKHIFNLTKDMCELTKLNEFKKLQFRVDDIENLASRITTFLNEESENIENSQKKMLLRTMDKVNEMKKWNDDAFTLIFKTFKDIDSKANFEKIFITLGTKLDKNVLDGILSDFDQLKNKVIELANKPQVDPDFLKKDIFSLETTNQDFHNKFSSINKTLNEIKFKLEFLECKVNQQPLDVVNIDKNGIANDEELILIKTKLSKIDQNIENYKVELDDFTKYCNNKFNNLNDKIDKKPNFSDLEKLKTELKDYIQSFALSFDKKYADKFETKKSFQALEKQIKALIDIMMKKQEEKSDTAMLVKKPLHGWTCASCEKNIINLQGNIAAYNSWNKLPKRDPMDRIAKVGSGFSLMLTKLNPDKISQFQNGFTIRKKLRNMNKSSCEKFEEMNITEKEEYDKDDSERPSSSRLPSLYKK